MSKTNQDRFPTGFYDITGKEIYTGDIVRAKNPLCEDCIVTKNSKGIFGITVANKKKWRCYQEFELLLQSDNYNTFTIVN